MLIAAAEMQAHERAVIAGGVSAADLMEAAAQGIADYIRHAFPHPGTLVCYCGRGNNAGDALAAARLLQGAGWKIATRLSCEPAEFRELPKRHWEALQPMQSRCASKHDVLHLHHQSTLVLLDGLVGLGSSGPLKPELRVLAAEMNALRKESHAEVVAIDLPSGLDPDTGIPCEDAVIADVTATIAIAKTGLVADRATSHVGRLLVVPLHQLAKEKTDPLAPEVLTPALLRPLLPRRRFDLHKGQAGRVGLIAGSARFPGAAVLCASGALRGGAGFVTLYCKAEHHGLLAAKLPPEIMLRTVSSFHEALAECDTLAIGPGLGSEQDAEVIGIIRDAVQPVVVDADALNALSRQGLSALVQAKGPRLLTPHPGEMTRLVGSTDADRCAQAEEFARQHPGNTLVLKGSRTVIATAGRPTRFNTTGHPGMASGGMGDVLSGLLAALLGQGVIMHDAASLGSWLLGRAAELALRQPHISPESLSASDVAHHLGAACNSLRRLPF